MKLPTKIKLEIRGNLYDLPIAAVNLKKNSKYGEETYIHMGAKNTASIIKQYVKKFFPTIKVWSKSDYYSGGSSVRTNVSNSDGTPIDQDIKEQISSFANMFKGGSFDGMYDIYNHREDDVETDNGTKLKYFPDYVFVENKPKWGSVEYWLADYNEYVNNGVDYSNPVKLADIEKVGGWLEYNKTYMTKIEERKVRAAYDNFKIK